MTVEPDGQTLERAVRAIVATGSGMERAMVIPGNDTSPSPAPTFATVTPITDVPEGLAWTRDTRIADRHYTDPEFTDGPTVDSEAFLPMELSYSVQWFGDGAADFARRFAVWAGSPAGTSEIARRGLTLYRAGPIRELAGLQNDDWEERRGLDLFLGAVFTDTRDVGIIESADVTVFPESFADRPPNDDRVSVPIPSPEQEGGDG